MFDFRMFINGEVPGGILTFFITWIVSLGIITYIYKSSELMPTERYGRNLFFVTIGNMVFYMTLLLIWPAERLKPNILIVPVQSEQSSNIQQAYPYFLSKVIHQAYPHKINVIDYESVKSLINYQNLQHPDTLLNYIIHYDIHFVVFSEFTDENQLKTKMIDTRYHGIESYADWETNTDIPLNELLTESANRIISELYPDLFIRATELSNTVIQILPSDPVRFARYLTVQDMITQGRYDETIQLLESTIDTDTSFSFDYYFLGRAYFEKAKLAVLDSTLQKRLINRAQFYTFQSIRKNQTNADFIFSYASILLFQSDFDQAEDVIKAGFEMDPYDYRAYLNFGRMHQSRWFKFEFLNNEKFETQSALVRRSLDINPFSAEANYFMGWFIDETRRTTDPFRIQAYDYYARALELNPNYLDALIQTWRVSILMGRYKDSEGYYNRLLKLTPGNPDALFFMGMRYYYQNELDSAIVYFNRHINETNSSSSHMYMGVIHEYKNDTTQAVYHYVQKIRNRESETDKVAISAYRRLYELDVRTWREINKEIPPVMIKEANF